MQTPNHNASNNFLISKIVFEIFKITFLYVSSHLKVFVYILYLFVIPNSWFNNSKFTISHFAYKMT